MLLVGFYVIRYIGIAIAPSLGRSWVMNSACLPSRSIDESLLLAVVCCQQIHVTSDAHQSIFDSIDLNWNMLEIIGSGRSVSAQSLAHNVLSDLQFKPLSAAINIYINSVYIHFAQIHKWIGIIISIVFIKIFQVWLKRIPSVWPFKYTFKDWIHIIYIYIYIY